MDICESCTLRQATDVVILDGEPNAVCEGCAAPGIELLEMGRA